MAQRMESVAPPGGVMLSESTARLVEWTPRCWASQSWCTIKGVDEPVPARRLLGMGDRSARQSAGASRVWSVGSWEMSAVERRCLDRAIDGPALWSGWSGPPVSARAVWCARPSAMASRPRCRGVHRPSASPTPARSRSTRSRGCCGRSSASSESRRAGCPRPGARPAPDADGEDLLLLDDLLGIGDPDAASARDRSGCPPPAVDRAGQHRRAGPRPPRRSTSIEDAHWIDEVSESMLADFRHRRSRRHARWC